MSVLRIPKRNIILVNLILVLVVILSTEARAETYGFKAITANSVADVAIGETQLYVNVDDPGTTVRIDDGTGTLVEHNQVLFTFINDGPEASSITDVYFDDGALLGIAAIDNSDPGVSFLQGASPGNLPSANSAIPPFQTTAGFLADSDSPVQPSGVNPGEELGITFALISDLDFGDVISAINLGFTDPWAIGNLRIGIHVQGFVGGGSESFILTPAPGALILGMLGFGAAGLKLTKFV